MYNPRQTSYEDPFFALAATLNISEAKFRELGVTEKQILGIISQRLRDINSQRLH